MSKMLTRSRYFNNDDKKPIEVEVKPQRKRPKKEHVSPVFDKTIKVEGTVEPHDKSSKKEASKWQPKNWKILFDNIREMRSRGDAPVDTVGCEKSFDVTASPKEQRFQVLVSLMLSSQTRDEINNAAILRLRKAGLSPDMILSISEDELGELIKPVGFWRKKVVYLKKTCEILKREYNGDIPDSVKGLCSLPGVGPKMAHLVMQVGWKQVTGIAVDTHVHRISNRLKFVRKPTKDPIQTEAELEDWIPRDLWTDFNSLLVGFGQTICTPVNPKCSQCLNRNICPSSNAKDRNK